MAAEILPAGQIIEAMGKKRIHHTAVGELACGKESPHPVVITGSNEISSCALAIVV